MNYTIPDSDEALLRACRVQVFRGSGPGGQSVNTADSAVRLIHKPSGIVVVARREHRGSVFAKRISEESLEQARQTSEKISLAR